MKAWQVLVLAVSILGAGGLVAAAVWSQERYHYSNVPVDNRLARVNRFTGEVEVYYGDRGWVILRPR